MPGVLGHIGLGKEASWGTGVAPSVFYPATEEINQELARMRIEEPHASVMPLPSEAGRFSIQGGLRGIPAYTDAIGHLLLAFFGQVNTSGAAAPYTHVFDVLNGNLGADHARPPYSVQVTKESKTRRFVGGQLNQLKLAQDAENYLKIDADFIFKDFQDGLAPATPSVPTDPVFGFRDLAVKRGGAAFPVRVESVEITFSNNLEVVNAVGSDRIAAVDQGVVNAQAQFTVEFDDAAIYSDFVNDVASDYEFVWTRGGKSLAIKFYRGVIVSHSDPLSAAGRLTAVFTVDAEYDPASGKMVDATLVNDTASY